MSKKNIQTSGDTVIGSPVSQDFISCIGCPNPFVCSDLGKCGNEISKKIKAAKSIKWMQKIRKRMAATKSI